MPVTAPLWHMHVSMQAFMWQEDLIGIVKFINACLHKMNPMGQTSDQPGVAGRDVI